MSRLQVVQDVIASGVVAVIRLKDPSKLKGVADALIAGGVTAMEVTMTVPGAVGLIEQLRQGPADGAPARRRHGARRRDGAAGDPRRRHASSSRRR